MPWFCRTPLQEVDDDNEVINCTDHGIDNEDTYVYIELFEIFVQ